MLTILFHLSADAQTGTIRGKITDANGTEPLAGASVFIKNTQRGAVSQPDGSFSLQGLTAGSTTLVVDYLGFKQEEVIVTVTPDQSTTVNVKLKAATAVLDGVIVTGLRRSQLNSINSKRAAINQRDVLSVDNLGRLPDVNVAEAAQRVAGVTIETDAGEGRFISIRGIQPSLINVTLNNNNLASTSGGRETPLNLLPIEMVGSIEVMKTITPDMEGTAIGGSVNINTISAFDKTQKQFLVFSADGMYTDQEVDYGQQNLQSRFALTMGKRFGKDEKFGIVAAANYMKRSFAQVILDPDRWQILQGTDAAGNKTPGYLGPNEIEIQYEDNRRKRYGVNADFEYRPDKNSRIYLKTLYTHTDERDYNNEFELTVAGVGTLTNQTPTTGYFDKGSGELDLSSSDNNQNLYSFNLGGEKRFGKLNVKLDGVFSMGRTKTYSMDGTFENDRSTESLLASSYNLNPFFFDILPQDLSTASNTDIYYLRTLNISPKNTSNENMYEASADFKYDINLSQNIPGYIKFGGRIRTREKVNDRFRIGYDDDSDHRTKAINRYTLTEFKIVPPEVPVGNTQPYVSGSAEQFREFFSNASNLSDTTRIFFRPDQTAAQEFVNDVTYSETISAAYVMGVFNLKMLQVIGGVRMENTQVGSKPFVNRDDNGFKEEKFKHSYTNFLPNLNLNFKLNKNFITRLAYTRTLGRANYDQLAGASVLNVNETNADGTVTGSYSGANPYLKPYLSNNFDLSIEYYFKSGGILSGGAFIKKIENQIFEQEYTQNNVDYAGQFFNELDFSQFINLNKASIQGLEASFDQAFTFLPGMLKGFGITTNLAYTKSKATYPLRETEELRLLRQPEWSYNIIPYYQYKGIELRAAITHRSDFLVSPRTTGDSFVRNAKELGFTEKDFDVYESERTVLDITAAYTFPGKKIKVLAQARNLNNAPEQEYSGHKSRYDSYQRFGASYFLGINLSH